MEHLNLFPLEESSEKKGNEEYLKEKKEEKVMAGVQLPFKNITLPKILCFFLILAFLVICIIADKTREFTHLTR